MQALNNPLKPKLTPYNNLPLDLIHLAAYLIIIYGTLLLVLFGWNLFVSISWYLFLKMNFSVVPFPSQFYVRVAFYLFSASILLTAGYMLLRINPLGVRVGIIAMVGMTGAELWLTYYRFSQDYVYMSRLEAVVFIPINIALLILLSTLRKKLRQ